ncbi:MAG TPA: archease [Thermoanaerobaculia bacterium]|nr:archease [Thermoanaerobaculia bacterium]
MGEVLYRELEHTADIAVEIIAATREELFAEALGAFTDIISERGKVEERLARDFALAGPHLDLLLVDWLDELVYAFEVEELLFRRADVRLTELTGGGGGRLAFAARAWGETLDPRRHPIKVLIKGVTYHALDITETAAGLRAQVIFDI